MKKFIFLCCVISAVFFVSGCAAEEKIKPEDIVYESKSILFSEPQTMFSMKNYLQITTVGTTTYGFEKNISEEDRYDFILKTEKILEKLGEDKPIIVNVYSETTYSDHFIIDGTVSTFYQTLPTVDQTMNIIFAVYGEYCNYGMVYGYANYILNDLFGYGYDVSVPVISAENDYLALNYLCFHPDFASEEDIELTKNTANAFVCDYISENGEKAFVEILKCSGNVAEIDKANTVLKNYYAENGVEIELTRNLYKNGGRANQYYVKSEYATFYVPEDWVDGITLMYDEDYPGLYDGFLNSDYAKTEKFFDINVDQMRQYQDLFSLDFYDNSLLISFESSTSGMDYSYYEHGSHQVHLEAVSSLMHEYIHSISPNFEYEKWKVEGFARYYSFRFDEYGNSMIEHSWLSTDMGVLFTEKTDRPVDFKDDIMTIFDLQIYKDGYDHPNDTYNTGASFINYLIAQFGERKVLDYILVNNDLKTLTDKNFFQLTEDWKSDIESRCSVFFAE